MAETPQHTEPISSAVPLIQPMFKKGIHGMLCPVAVAFYAREGYQNTTFHIGSTSHQREHFFFVETLAQGPTISREAQLNRINDVSLEFIRTVGMALVELQA